MQDAKDGAADLRSTIADHERWLASEEKSGSRADLEGRDLRGAALTNANLSRANLAHADFADADLFGASLSQSNLRGADLTNAMGLSAAQLAGADLMSAKLPAAIAGFDGLAQVANLSKNAARTFAFLVFACLYSCVTVAMTTDARLLTRFVSSPLPVIQTAIPLFLFYIVAPFIITALYLYLHLQLQGLWEEIATLPAVFPDGRTLSSKVHPWLLTSLAQRFGTDQRRRSAARLLEMAIAWLSAWALEPITLMIFWLRYLPRHDGAGSVVHVALLGLSTVVGTWSHQRAAGFLSHQEPRATSPLPVALGSAIIIGGAILSYGAIRGIDVAAENQRTPARLTASAPWFRTAVPSLFTKLGLRAFADMKDAAVS
ncbi:MAG TPA: pentapeptide repeat-containing protein, partial [Thermoanaerobaculia bacterium]